ncbi:uncharacterized protein LOC126837672, partial [Adelges cooleyi]|uniref:uncharacterized protein LOC126837672 n=1 Tax=Adelges cooleyi TaxID=133065 RepID=UPI00218052EC
MEKMVLNSALVAGGFVAGAGTYGLVQYAVGWWRSSRLTGEEHNVEPHPNEPILTTEHRVDEDEVEEVPRGPKPDLGEEHNVEPHPFEPILTTEHRVDEEVKEVPRGPKPDLGEEHNVVPRPNEPIFITEHRVDEEVEEVPRGPRPDLRRYMEMLVREE